MHSLVGRPGSLDRLRANATIHFLAALQCSGKTLTGFPNFLSGHIGGGGQQCARVFGQLFRVIADGLCLLVHAFCWFEFFNGKVSASARWVASGEFATARIEFLPPNGLGTVSLADGSGIHWPSTTKQYS